MKKYASDTFPLSHLAVLVVLAVFLSGTPLQAQERNAANSVLNSRVFRELYSSPADIRLTKSEQPLSTAARDYLLDIQAKNGSANFWVFFTDKGENVSEALAAPLERSAVHSRSLRRRAKVGQNRIVFADLPVHAAYTREISDLGAQTLRVSRWLNAGAFSGSMEQIEKISALPFVVEIRPAPRHTRPNLPQPENTTPEENIPPGNDSESPLRDGDILNYGQSQAQITQISSDFGHVQGYKGQGVTIAMLDTGYRKTHEAFVQAFLEGRVLAEYDFINNDANTANEAGDLSSQWSHGTLTFSTCGGQLSGKLYGPAYGANFLLAKTENVASETIQEEFDWVAAMEWADSLGADVISSSLAYSAWYTPASYDGVTAVTTIAAGMAAALGIIVCNANGNGGPGPLTLAAPADAFDILSCGAVDATGLLASFSSRGPTADGRIKPEVCARGVQTYCATSTSNISYGLPSGTSLSTPLVAGLTAQMISAQPTWSPLLIMKALKETASNAAAPDNNLGWGIVNLEAALDWGANFTANGQTGLLILELGDTVAFVDNSDLSATSWQWDFGDGQIAGGSSVTHSYDSPGLYDIALTIQTEFGQLTRIRNQALVVIADTVTLAADSAFPGRTLEVSVHLTNTLALRGLEIPINYNSSIDLVFDSVTAGARTGDFTQFTISAIDPFAKRVVVSASTTGPPLDPGSGEALKVFFTLDRLTTPGVTGTLDSGSTGGKTLLLSHEVVSYRPEFNGTSFLAGTPSRGDANADGRINIIDITFLISSIFAGGPGPITTVAGDADGSGAVNIADVTFLIARIFAGGPPPPP